MHKISRNKVKNCNHHVDLFSTCSQAKIYANQRKFYTPSGCDGMDKVKSACQAKPIGPCSYSDSARTVCSPSGFLLKPATRVRPETRGWGSVTLPGRPVPPPLPLPVTLLHLDGSPQQCDTLHGQHGLDRVTWAPQAPGLAGPGVGRWMGLK